MTVINSIEFNDQITFEGKKEVLRPHSLMILVSLNELKMGKLYEIQKLTKETFHPYISSHGVRGALKKLVWKKVVKKEVIENNGKRKSYYSIVPEYLDMAKEWTKERYDLYRKMMKEKFGNNWL